MIIYLHKLTINETRPTPGCSPLNHEKQSKMFYSMNHTEPLHPVLGSVDE